MLASRIRSVATRCTQIAFVVAALWYAFSAAVLTLPVSPAKLEYQTFLHETFTRFFYQNWSLFAPNPVSEDDVVLVHCSSNAALTKPDQIPANQWQDIVSPLWDLAREHRLAPWERISRTLTYPVRGYQGNSSEIVPWAVACMSKKEEACEAFDAITAAMRERARVRLVELATAYCRAAFPNMTIANVGIRLRQIQPPPWSRRFDGTPTSKDTEVGVFPPAEETDPAAFFIPSPNP